MKLFQIEEPDGSPPVDGPGVSVGIALGPAGGLIAIAVGGNAEILPGPDGDPRLAGTIDEIGLTDLLLGLRERAEKQLARPVTHAVIAGSLDDRQLQRAAVAAGLIVLWQFDWASASALVGGEVSDEAAALGAAIEAEDNAPLPSG